jgi:hypothetical protein
VQSQVAFERRELRGDIADLRGEVADLMVERGDVGSQLALALLGAGELDPVT